MPYRFIKLASIKAKFKAIKTYEREIKTLKITAWHGVILSVFILFSSVLRALKFAFTEASFYKPIRSFIYRCNQIRMKKKITV